MLDFLQKKPAAHLWYRVDEGDQDVASFFHHIGNLLPPRAASELPVFGPEYADQPAEFARRFFRAFFRKLSRVGLLVIDDLHYGIETAQFRTMLAIMLRELPDDLQCACISRTLPPEELAELTFKGQLTVLDQSILQFSDAEARALVKSRSTHALVGGRLCCARLGRRSRAARRSCGRRRPARRSAAAERFAHRANCGVRGARASASRRADGRGTGGNAQGQPACPRSRRISSRISRDRKRRASLLARLHQRQLLVTRGRKSHAASITCTICCATSCRTCSRSTSQPASWQVCASKPRRC